MPYSWKVSLSAKTAVVVAVIQQMQQHCNCRHMHSTAWQYMSQIHYGAARGQAQFHIEGNGRIQNFCGIHSFNHSLVHQYVSPRRLRYIHTYMHT